MRVLALMAVHNEEAHLERCLRHLEEQGVEVCLIDHGSNDATPDIAQAFTRRNVAHIETVGRDERGFHLGTLLALEQRFAGSLQADWFIHHDADEIRTAPPGMGTLAQALAKVDQSGHNAVNFDEFIFIPAEGEDHEGLDYVARMRRYLYYHPRPLNRVNAWKNLGVPITLAHGGHQVEFEGRAIYPDAFTLRHYPMLSKVQALRRCCGRVYSHVEVARGWSHDRVNLRPSDIRFPDPDTLQRLDDGAEPSREHPTTDQRIFKSTTEAPPSMPARQVRFRWDAPPAPFVVGVPRSGTTLLRLMLDAHPNLAIPPELHIIPEILSLAECPSDSPENLLRLFVSNSRFPFFGISKRDLEQAFHALPEFTVSEGVRAFYALYAARFHKPRWGEKTPANVLFMERIQALLPESRFVHIIRDGRDSTLSVKDLWFRPGTFEETAAHWLYTTTQARQQAQTLRHYLEIRFEDLVTDPEPVLRRVCSFLDLRFDPCMLRQHERAKERLNEEALSVRDVGHPLISAEQRLSNHQKTLTPPDPGRARVWANTMSPEHRLYFERLCGPRLHEFGYETSRHPQQPFGGAFMLRPYGDPLRNQDPLTDARLLAETLRQELARAQAPTIHAPITPRPNALRALARKVRWALNPKHSELLGNLDAPRFNAQGAQTAPFLGWCFHPRRAITGLSLLAADTRVPLYPGLLRTDVAQAHSQHPNALFSGFHGSAIPPDHGVDWFLEAIVEGGQVHRLLVHRARDKA